MAKKKLQPTLNPRDIVKTREDAQALGLLPPVKGCDPRSPNGSRKIPYYSIRKFLNTISDDICPDELIRAFRMYWPSIKKLTMKEAWLRSVYIQAISGNMSATYFIADRMEGKVPEGNTDNGKGTILEAIDKLTEEADENHRSEDSGIQNEQG